MHHVLLDRWSQGASPLHRRDARAKILTLLVFLILLATTPADAVAVLVTYVGAIGRGDTDRGAAPRRRIVSRHGGAALFTHFRLDQLAGGRTAARVGVGGEELSIHGCRAVTRGRHAVALVARRPGEAGRPALTGVSGAISLSLSVRAFRTGAAHAIGGRLSRGIAGRRRGSGFRAATGALAVLFARSYERAEGIHRAMQARGFSGRFSLLGAARFGARDGAFLFIVSAFLILVRVA